jgi:hypothetical protein
MALRWDNDRCSVPILSNVAVRMVTWNEVAAAFRFGRARRDTGQGRCAGTNMRLSDERPLPLRYGIQCKEPKISSALSDTSTRRADQMLDFGPLGVVSTSCRLLRVLVTLWKVCFLREVRVVGQRQRSNSRKQHRIRQPVPRLLLRWRRRTLGRIRTVAWGWTHSEKSRPRFSNIFLMSGQELARVNANWGG